MAELNASQRAAEEPTRIPNHAAVDRVVAALQQHSHPADITWLADSARTAAEAAAALEVAIGQIASSIVFRGQRDAGAGEPNTVAVLVVTSGRHRVDTARVESQLGIRLGRADADFVRACSGFAIGGVSPVGWQPAPDDGSDAHMSAVAVVDYALADYDVVWAAAGHPHAVFPTTFEDLVRLTGGRAMTVGD